MTGAPFLAEYLAEVRRRCSSGSWTLATGIGTGYGAILLSLQGCRAEGVDNSPRIVERARQANALLAPDASFCVGDLYPPALSGSCC